MRAFSVTYNPRIDEIKIAFSKDFNDAYWILKMDILQDAICDLQKVYEETRKQGHKALEKMGASPAEAEGVE
jgi:hypothetical protein